MDCDSLPRSAQAETTAPATSVCASPALTGTAVVLDGPGQVAVRSLHLTTPGPADVVIDIAYSGISTGTERLLWTGTMPPFPGLRYPLVPGYESAGTVLRAPDGSGLEGAQVFVPGAQCYEDAAGLFGGASSRLVVPAERIVRTPCDSLEETTLLALAATGYRAATRAGTPPDLIIGNGVLGRLIARITTALQGETPTVWEIDPGRRDGGAVDPDDDPRRDYAVICDASGDPRIVDRVALRLKKSGAIVLAGFYSDRVSFDFPPAFMREARLVVSAEWTPADLDAVCTMVRSGALSLGGLITHRSPAADAESAYRTAFSDPSCLKMILDWSEIDD